jgi:hypothetical protein
MTERLMNRRKKYAGLTVLVCLSACSLDGGIDSYAPLGDPIEIMSCSGTFGSNSLASSPVSYFDHLNARAVSAVEFDMSLNGIGGTQSGSVSLDAFLCGDGSSLGIFAGTTTLSTSFTLSLEEPKLFIFKPPIYLQPCAGGKRTIAFKFGNVSVSGGATASNIHAHVVLVGQPECTHLRSASATALSPGPHNLKGRLFAHPF